MRNNDSSHQRRTVLRSLGAIGLLGTTGKMVARPDDESLESLTDDCSDPSTLALGSDTDRLTVDTTNTRFFERPDGATDGARITRTTTEDAQLIYKVPGVPGHPTNPLPEKTVTVEFHRHQQYGGELLVDGRPADYSHPANSRTGTIEQYGSTDGGWIHELHTLKPVGNKSTLTITGGQKEWASQIGRVEYTYKPDPNPRIPDAPKNVQATPITESAVQLYWEPDPSFADYHALYLDGRTVRELDSSGFEQGTVLTGLSPGTHEIGISSFGANHDETRIVTTTVELPAEPTFTFVHDCSDLDALSSQCSFRGALSVDRSNQRYFRRPDGSTDAGRIVQDGSRGSRTVDVVYATPKPVDSVIAEYHVNQFEGGTVDCRATTRDDPVAIGRLSPVDASVNTDGKRRAGWQRFQLEATDLPADTTYVAFRLDRESLDTAPWSPQLGHVAIEYER